MNYISLDDYYDYCKSFYTDILNENTTTVTINDRSTYAPPRELSGSFIAGITMTPAIPKIKNVIFNDPATIVFWEDNTKTIVKCQPGEIFDAEKGLTMCITKKIYGNKSNFNNVLKKWLPKEKEIKDMTIQEAINEISQGWKQLSGEEKDIITTILWKSLWEEN